MLRKITIATCATLTVLGGCATQGDQKDSPPTPLQQASNRVVDYSKLYLAEQQALRERLEKINPPAAPQPVVPTYDALSNVKVTLNVDNADIQFVLQALTKQAGVNLLIHPTLVESPHRISVHFTDVPASQVLKQVMRLADLAGQVKDNVLVVRPLEERIFHLDFLEMEQTTRFSAGGDVLGSTTQTGATDSGVGGSSMNANVLTGEFKVEGTSARTINPYEQLTKMLNILVGDQNRLNSNEVSGAGSVAEVGELSQISSAKQGETPLYSLNRMTGTLYVQAKPSVMETVAKLVTRYKKVLDRQIVLEAQVLEIALNDDFQYGIDWTELNHKAALAFGPVGQQVGPVNTTFPTNGDEQPGRSLVIPGQVLEAKGRAFGSLSLVRDAFALTASVLEGFGDVNVLSNPTIRSKHGQASIISVGTSNSFITQSGSTAISGVGSTITQNIQTSTVFDGLVLGVIPFISDGGRVTLSIHPIQSNVDPGSLGLVSVGDSAITLPRVSLKEMSTLLTMQDGDVVILGGLIDHQSNNSTDQIPGAGNVPILGYFFKSRKKASRVRELVVVLKVTVI
ncbi:MAG: pilus (MSHA type) biogenesis protein MshL [Gammaproteobacteria bacterium]|nr:pilus (MSHA type) biogenesis protein MshL [Gammaproteobacteria bacterium]